LKPYLFPVLSALFVLSAAVQAQNGPSEPRPVLIDVISGRSAARIQSRSQAASTVNTTTVSATDTEARTFELMNAERLASGLKSLEWNEQLVSLARMHSQSMAAGKFFSHKGADGGYVDDRAAKLGIFNWLAIGENIAFMKGYNDPATMAVEKWMQSTSHKKNILNGHWRESAIGVAVADDGSIYLTQVFITR
jgi:uncharacterized protein YkwD